MPVHTLTKLQYSEDKKGPFALYIYEPNSLYHHGAVYFMKNPQYPEEGEISIGEAKSRVAVAVADDREVRITDGGDMLVFHARNGQTLYPNDPEKFWEDIGI